MKKIFTLVAMAMVTIASQAQSLQFCYEDGTIIPDGSVVVVSTPDPESLEWDEVKFESGIFIKNASENVVNATLNFNVTELPEESELSVCLGMSCHMYSEVGEYSIANVSLAAGSASSMQCHWTPAIDWDTEEYIYDSCSGEYTLLDGSTKCSTISVLFVYADPSGVESVAGDNKVVKAFDLMGRQTNIAHGIVIEKMNDGSVRKVMK